MPSTWPEQDACARWWDAHWRELKEEVTKERLVQQGRAEKAEQRIQQLEEALRKIRVYAASRWILETVDAALSSEAPGKEGEDGKTG